MCMPMPTMAASSLVAATADPSGFVSNPCAAMQALKMAARCGVWPTKKPAARTGRVMGFPNLPFKNH